MKILSASEIVSPFDAKTIYEPKNRSTDSLLMSSGAGGQYPPFSTRTSKGLRTTFEVSTPPPRSTAQVHQALNRQGRGHLQATVSESSEPKRVSALTLSDAAVLNTNKLEPSSGLDREGRV
jgi:hypothetical protein